MASDSASPHKLGIVRENLRMFGLWRTLGDIIGYLFTGPPRDRFDRKYGVVTSGSVDKHQAGVTDAAALADAIKYVPISEQVMRHVLARATQIADPAEVAFVDLGCGKGRALVMASWFPFQAVLGVELSPAHAELAQQNVTAHLAAPRGPKLRCRNLSVACANALHCELPATDLLVFMYRPFKGQVFQGVIDRLHAIAARTGRRVIIAYVCPIEQRMLERHPAFHKLHDYQVIVEEHSWSLWECRPAQAAALPATRDPAS
jgi:SAM-dependent methyltransferase